MDFMERGSVLHLFEEISLYCRVDCMESGTVLHDFEQKSLEHGWAFHQLQQKSSERGRLFWTWGWYFAGFRNTFPAGGSFYGAWVGISPVQTNISGPRVDFMERRWLLV